MLCEFLLYSKVISVIHMFIFFLIFFSIMVYHRILNIVMASQLVQW